MRAPRGRRAIGCGIALLAILATPVGCGEKDGGPPPDPAAERTDRPATPPRGWRTVLNRKAGFTVAVPRPWAARTRRGATLIRSDDSLLALTVLADRSRAGLETPARSYARQALAGLPGLERAQRRPAGAVRSPYENASLEATGTPAASRRPQRVRVTVFRRPGQVTYTAIAFRNARVRPRRHDRALDRLLASFRARPPEL